MIKKDGENIPKLESAEVVLVLCNLVKNNYQHTSKVYVENTLKVMPVCHLQENVLINMVKN